MPDLTYVHQRTIPEGLAYVADRLEAEGELTRAQRQGMAIALRQHAETLSNPNPNWCEGCNPDNCCGCK